ncbi:DUF6765 family protein [Solemya pervernicosa gill symbiont]|uniref:DUF6765 family protein n=1 Tax=Solemya pervernicosa gill symbiont TaxID=642797 RepID=UPI0009988770|nr:DUF6765 family protein [Solemya pervernicosa gill symbiont]
MSKIRIQQTQEYISMTYDYHYHATMFAALTAGFEYDDAVEIASASLFVDYCDYSNFSYNFNIEGENVGRPILTSQYNNVSEWVDKSDPSIWALFHFLPGNFKVGDDIKNHVVRDVQGVKLKEFITRPNSPFVDYLRDSVPNQYHDFINSRPRVSNYVAGIYAHIISDTYAHQDFSGFNQGSINDCGPSVLTNKNGEIKELDVSFASTKDDLKAAPPGFNANMGHGRMGHMPDFGFAKYSYQPAWKKSNGKWVYHERDNKNEFIKAFTDLVSLFYRIRTGERDVPVCIDSNPGLSVKDELKILKSNVNTDHLLVPRSFIDLLIKDYEYGDNHNGATIKSAKTWADKLISMGYAENDPLGCTHKDGTYDKDWEKRFMNTYSDSFDITGFPNVVEPSMRKAELKIDSPFYDYQAAAAVTLRVLLDGYNEFDALKDGREKVVKNGWAVKTSRDFEKHVHKNLYGIDL